MGATPAYASTVHNASALITSTETNLQVPTQAVSLFVAGASGSKIEELDVQASQTSLVATTVAGLVYVFLYDGSIYHLFDTIAVTAITASTTVAPFRLSKTYNNLVLKTGWTVYVAQSIAGNAGVLKVHALGADF
jgi:hypothetical protein